MQAIEMRGITKRFDTVIANDQVDFALEQGEIHALLGENGAGKTTLMRILYGLYHADEGEIRVFGNPVHITAPAHALQNGIGMVTQHFTLVPTLTVAENIALGYTKSFRIHMPDLEQSVAEAARKFGVQVQPGALVRHLSVGERQRVEILKALYRNVKVLILDEPTAVLVPQEVDDLFDSLKNLRETGLSVVFISHKLNEVMAVCDRITVLRAGKTAGHVKKSETSKTELARLMVGREMTAVIRKRSVNQGRQLLRVENMTVPSRKGLIALKGISLDVREGEILGIAGVSGNGQTELTQILAGTLQSTSGKVFVDGQDLTGSTPKQMMAAGVARIPEDRHAGVVSELSVAENMALENLEDFVHHGALDYKLMRVHAKKLIEEYQIKASPNDRIRTLSGGNMQKVILARTLSRQPKVVIASQPTRGLDVGATEYVRGKLLQQRERGAAVLLLSEDLEEIMALSDRVAVIYEGEMVGVMPVEQATLEQLGLMMAGAKRMTTSAEIQTRSEEENRRAQAEG
jgi:general nucleoside transport system ATP-binding protein